MPASRILIILLAIGIALPAMALADGPVSLALFPPVQVLDEDQSVTAFRFSILYGRNVDLTGLDLSLVGRNTGSVTGVALAAIGMVDGDFTGWQGGYLASLTDGNMQGLQTGLYTRNGVGSSGVQLGFINTSEDFSGLQIGALNVTNVMRSGLQIGLVNIIRSKESLGILPFVNWSF